MTRRNNEKRERDDRARRPKAETEISKQATRRLGETKERYEGRDGRNETIENTTSDYRGKTETNRQTDEMSDESKHTSSHFRPTPSYRLLSRPPASISSPAPRSGDERTRGSISGNDLRAYTTERAAEQTGTDPLSHSRSTGPYSHRHATRARTRAR